MLTIYILERLQITCTSPKKTGGLNNGNAEQPFRTIPGITLHNIS